MAGKDTLLHTVYYEDETDSSCYLPGRYATPSETADCLKQMAHAGRGRFHWHKIGGERYVHNLASERSKKWCDTHYNSYLAGIVESDDVSIVHGELNKAYNYAQNVSLLRTLCMRRNTRNTSLAFLVLLT